MAGVSTSCRMIRARSYAEELCPATSSPDGVPATVSKAPIRSAVAFIAARVTSTPPAARARALAASLPDCMTSAS